MNHGELKPVIRGASKTRGVTVSADLGNLKRKWIPLRTVVISFDGLNRIDSQWPNTITEVLDLASSRDIELR